MKKPFIPSVICLTDPSQTAAASVAGQSDPSVAKPAPLPVPVVVPEVLPALKPLSPGGRQREFELCEADIEQSMVWDLIAGLRFVQIRDQKLYEAKYPSFPAYCVQRWGHVRRQIDRLILAAQVVAELRPFGLTLPQHESHVRPLLRLPREQRAPAWQKVLAAAAGGVITAKLVETVVAELLPKKVVHRKRGAAKATSGMIAVGDAAPVKAVDAANVAPPASVTARVKSISKLIDLAKFYHDGNGFNPGRAYNTLCELESEFCRRSTALLAQPAPPPLANNAVPQQDSKGATARAASPAANPDPLPDNLAQSLGSLERLIELAKEHTVGKAVALLLDAEAELVRLRMHLAAQSQLPKAEITVKAKG